MNEVELSILVPVYNTATYLYRCVTSLMAQTVRNIEIILVDDGSTDGAGALCDELAVHDDRLRVIHQENAGPSAARMAGIIASRGRYLGFVDSDDYVDSDMYERLLAPVRQDDSIDISIGGNVVDNLDASMRNPYTERDVQAWDDGLVAMEKMFSNKSFTWSLCDKIYAHHLFTDEDFLSRWPHSHGEDIYVNAHVMPLARRIVFQPIYGYHYCMNADSMTHAAFTPEKLVPIDIEAALMDKYMRRDELVASIGSAMFGLLRSYLKNMQKSYPLYQKELHKYQELARKWLPKISLTDEQREMMEILLLAPTKYHEWIENKEKELLDFCRAADDNLYIYGAGIYGRRLGNLLKMYGIEYAGFVETEKSRDFCDGHNIYSLSALEEKAYLLLGMSKKNTQVVEKMLGARFPHRLAVASFLECT